MKRETLEGQRPSASSRMRGVKRTRRSRRIALPILRPEMIPKNFYAGRKPITNTRFRKLLTTASSKRLPLVPAINNKKMGQTLITKGRWQGKALFALALEEGPTCPKTCLWLRTGLCGAVNYRGRRFRVNRQLYRHLDRQIGSLLGDHANGIVVRLHVTGDFPTPGYARFWARMLKKYQGLHVWGHTHRRGRFLAMIDRQLNRAFPERALIRSSDSGEIAHAAITVLRIDKLSMLDGLVCPATLKAAQGGPIVKRGHEAPLSVCANCGACWNREIKNVYFPHMVNGVGPAQYSVLDCARGNPSSPDRGAGQ